MGGGSMGGMTMVAPPVAENVTSTPPTGDTLIVRFSVFVPSEYTPQVTKLTSAVAVPEAACRLTL